VEPLSARWSTSGALPFDFPEDTLMVNGHHGFAELFSDTSGRVVRAVCDKSGGREDQPLVAMVSSEVETYFVSSIEEHEARNQQ
jgi:hypothetical protein